VVIAEKDSYQQVHEEKRADEDEDDGIEKVYDLAVVFYWALDR
jgi:hypothetical protein